MMVQAAINSLGACLLPATRGSVLGRVTILFALIYCTAGCSYNHRQCVPQEFNRPGALIPIVQTADDTKPIDPEVFENLATRLKVEAGSDPAKPIGRLASRPSPTASKTETGLEHSDNNSQVRATKALVLSGGGMYGAYAAGVLGGWTASGTRPTFDVVTGISTGGLIATFAFLGPQYDQKLADLYTSVRTRDIYCKRSVMALVWSDALASSTPLKRRIDAEIDDDIIREVAAAHAGGRRIYVGTANVDTGRLVIWDMGAIAASDRPDKKELYRNILLATSSVPGLLPPVPITVEINGRRYTELHVDGGATTALFLRASELSIDMQTVRTGRPPLAESDAFIIVSGKLYQDPKCAKRNAIRIGARSLDSLVASQIRGELFRVYTLCLLSGMRFHLTSIPEDFKLKSLGMSFDQAEMKRLFESGYQRGASGQAWRNDPPVADPSELSPPRIGNEFIAPGARP